MKFCERNEWTYDPDIFKRCDTQTALKIHDEYVTKHSPNLRPRIFVINRSSAIIDPLWHMPISHQTPIERTIDDLPCINVHQKPQWKSTPQGIQPMRQDQFWFSNLGLQKVDWFPLKGDQIYYNGYRYFIWQVVIGPESYWQQTNVWLGLYVDAIIPPTGDAAPPVNPGEATPTETSPTQYGL